MMYHYIMANRLTIENMTLKLWQTKPKFKGKVRVVKKWRKNGQTIAMLMETKTKTISGPMYWSTVLSQYCCGVPDTFECYEHEINRPTNYKLCIVYLVEYKNGNIKVGVTSSDAFARHGSNLNEVICEIQTYDCCIHESDLLKQFNNLFGPPNEGAEAWAPRGDRKKMMIHYFKKHFKSVPDCIVVANPRQPVKMSSI